LFDFSKIELGTFSPSLHSVNRFVISVLLFLLPSPGASILVRVFRSNFFDGAQLEKRFLVLWAANVFFDPNEVVEVDNLHAKATKVHTLGAGRNRFEIANRFEEAEQI